MKQLSDSLAHQVFITCICGTYTVIFGLYSVISIFIPIDKVIKNYDFLSLQKKGVIVLIFLIGPALAGLGVSVIKLLYLTFKKQCSYPLSDAHAKFIVEYGDLHDYMFPKKAPKKSYTVIIPVNNQLNQLFEYRPTQGRSIHSNWLKELEENSKEYKIKLEQLADQSKNWIKDKYPEEYKEDKNTEYKLGDGIRVNGDVIGVKNVNYFFLATNMMYNNDVAIYEDSNKEKTYLSVIQSLIDVYTQELNQQDVYIPIIGGGFVKQDLKKSSTELLSIMYSVFKFNGNKFNSDIHVVIYKRKNQKPPASIFLK